MVNILSSSLWLVLFTAAVSNASQNARKRLNKKTLMKNAVPVDRQGRPRQLEEEEDQEFYVTGDYTMQFNRCISVQTEPADSSYLYDENLQRFTSTGRIVSQKSFVLVNVCKTKYCDYYVGDENLYMIDLQTYMAATTVYYQERTEGYCEACANSVNYCTWINYQRKHGRSDNWNAWLSASQNMYDDAVYAYQEEKQAQQNGDGEEEEGEQGEEEGDRRLRNLMDYRNYKVVECETCDQMGCWDKDDAEEAQMPDDDYAAKVAAYKQQIQMENVGEWVSQFTECQATTSDFMNDGNFNYPLYAGFMCNQDGTGVEIGMFLDETCSVYAGTTSYFRSIRASESDLQYLDMARDMIMFPFQHDMDCNADVRYMTLQQYRNYAQNYYYENNNEAEDSELSEYCQTIFGEQDEDGGDGGDGGEEGQGAISMRDCESDGDYYEEEVEDDDVAAQYAAEYDMYSYMLSYEDSLDITESCKVVKNMHGRFPSVYRWDGSGQLFNYGTSYKGSYLDNLRRWYSQHDTVDGTLIASIVIGVLVALLSFGCIVYSICHPRSVPNKFVPRPRTTIPRDSKAERLVDPGTGRLA